VTQSGKPLVSIGMPIYNSERHLRQALDSLLSQSLDDFELIISDNASTDGTGDICVEYAERDKRVRYIRQARNIGAPRNWNAVLYEARGEFFKWASGNDYCSPGSLERCVEKMRREPDIALCYGRTDLVDNDGNSLGVYHGDPDISDSRPSNRFKQILKGLALNNAQQGVIRTDILMKTGLDRVYPGGDISLMAELALHGRLVLLPEIMLYRRFAPGTIMAMRSPAEVTLIYNPQARKPAMFLRGHFHWDNLVSILRAPISFREQVRALAVAVKYAAWDREKLWSEVRSLWATLPSTTTMRAMNNSLRIGLLGPYASANLGDTSIQMAVMRTLKERLGPVRFLGISTDPADVVRTHGISAMAISGDQPRINPWDPDAAGKSESFTSFPTTESRWIPRPLRNLRRIYRATASLDLLIISGSGQIDDFWGGPWGHPFRMLVWSACAKRQGVPVAVLGVGVDELKTRLGAWFSLRALNLTQFRAFRDGDSLDMLRKMGLSAESMVCPDPAFGIRLPKPDANAPSKRPYAIISPIARGAWPGAEDGVYENYLRMLAKVSEHLLETGLDVRFACSQTRMDVPIVERIKKKMSASAVVKCLLEPIGTVDDYLRAAGPAELVVASRLHAAILALVAGAPVVTIADTRKVRTLMQDMQMQEYSMDLKDSGLEAVIAAVDAALAKRDALRKQITGLQRNLRATLATTYDHLLAAVFPKILARADFEKADKIPA
jgi:polysaccharide pyruvyl transferase WcaK-like protein/glycosyltransferase involved in cell wall biosynthesis